MSETVRVYLALGSNLGERKANLRQAIALLQAHSVIRVRQVSRFYETEPVGIVDERDPQWFINAVIGIDTEFTPEQLLVVCLAVEQRLGRKRTETSTGNAPRGYVSRTMDIDILLYGDQVIELPSLKIPHPRMQERTFMMVPLMDVAPDVIHPALKKTVRVLTQTLLGNARAKQSSYTQEKRLAAV